MSMKERRGMWLLPLLAFITTHLVSQGVVANTGDEATCPTDELSEAPEAPAFLQEEAAHGAALLAVSKQLTKLDRASLAARPGRQDPAAFVEPGNTSLVAGDQPPGVPTDVVITVAPLTCGTPVFAPSGTCPKTCPFFTEEPGLRSCFFRCVRDTECGTVDPRARIADKDEMFCRPCHVPGCAVCQPPGNVDKCQYCAPGYALDANGGCVSIYAVVWLGIFVLVGVGAVFIGAWYLQKLCAPVTNEDGLKEGLLYRSSLKLHMPHEGTERKKLWPLSTNMHVEKVAGPGFTLFWNFELASLMWAFGMVVTWVGFAYMTDPQQLSIGLLPAQTPVQLCSVTMMGRELQKRMMWAKALFLFVAYLGTFAFFLGYAIMQKRTYAKMNEGGSMRDFAAICTGLSTQTLGSEKAEEQLQKALQDATGETVVGVSICWDYGGVSDDVQAAIDRELLLREPQTTPQVEDNRPRWRKAFDQVDKLFFFTGPQVSPSDDNSRQDDSITEEQIVSMLKSIATTDSAFIVFKTEGSRDAAVEAVKQRGGLTINGSTVRMRRAGAEPDTVKWENFAVTTGTRVFRICLGFLGIFVALAVWCLCFYFPYAYFQSMFDKDEPGPVSGMIFSMLVVAGNQIMYQVCNAISEKCGFRFGDHAQGFYTFLYTFACMLNVICDLGIECFLGYKSMVAKRVHTADGQLLENLSSITKIFESYPMQKGLGQRLFAYNFPGTFLLPFIVEPVAAIFMPYHICELLLRTHPEVRGREAEKSLDIFTPMDMSRYGDILLNMMLVALCFFFPSGLILKMFLVYIIAHMYIYCYDQYRVLRTVPSFCVSEDIVELYAQGLMTIPPAILLCGFIFKANCVGSNYCLEGWPLVTLCLFSATCHVALHLTCIFVIVPLIARHQHLEDHTKTTKPFEEASRKIPCSWFTANPVHCLRSKYIYKHNPPCLFYTQGKEYLMQANKTIGIHYEDHSRSEAEKYLF